MTYPVAPVTGAQVKEAEAFPGVPTRFVGVARFVAWWTGTDGLPSATALTAETAKSYAVPGVRPTMEAVVPGAPLVMGTPLSQSRYFVAPATAVHDKFALVVPGVTTRPATRAGTGAFAVMVMV